MEPPLSSRINQCLQNYNKISNASDNNYLYLNADNNLELQAAEQKSVSGSFWTAASKTVTNLSSGYTGVKSDWQSVAGRIDTLNRELSEILESVKNKPLNEEDRRKLTDLNVELKFAEQGLSKLAAKYEKEAGGWFGEKVSKREASLRFNHQHFEVEHLRNKIANYLTEEREKEVEGQEEDVAETAFGFASELILTEEEVTSSSPDGDDYILIGEEIAEADNIPLDQSIASPINQGKVKQVWEKTELRNKGLVYYTPLTPGAEKELREEVAVDGRIDSRLTARFPNENEFYLAVDLKEVPEEKRIKNPKTKTHEPMYTVQCRKADANLEKFIRRSMPLPQRFEICSQVLAGFNYLHGVDYVQGDPKPENILVFNTKSQDENLVVRIADFGKAVEVDPKHINSMRGNPRFSPPENATTKEGEVYGAAFILVRVLEENFLSDENDTLLKVKNPKERASSIRRGIEKYVVEHPDCYQIDQWVSWGGFLKTAGNYVAPKTEKSLGAAEAAVHTYIDALGIALAKNLPSGGVEALTNLLKEMTSSDPALRPTIEEAKARYDAIFE